jgi:hypothetical protein
MECFNKRQNEMITHVAACRPVALLVIVNRYVEREKFSALYRSQDKK